MAVNRIGLVLEGGGMRGMYTAGVLDVFMKNNIEFDAVIGVSAGAIHGGTYIAGQPGRNLRYYKKYCTDPRFISIKNLLTTGDIAGEEFCYHELPDKLDVFNYEAFRNNKTPFYAVCSNVKTGKAEYIRISDMKKQIDVLRASASLPYCSRMVDIGGEKYLDGGCTDSIPAEAFIEMGYEYNVLVLTRDINYRKSPEMKFPAKIRYRKYPEFRNALLKRHEMYNNTVNKILELESEDKVFVIRPKIPLKIGRLEKDPEKIQSIYDIGFKDAENKLHDMKKWIKEKRGNTNEN